MPHLTGQNEALRYRTWPNLATMFFEIAAQKGEKPFLWAKRTGAYHSLSWAEAARQVHALATGLRKAGVMKGDRVVLLSENRPEWAIADLAIMTAGAISVPAYATNTVADNRHILENSGACGAIVSSAVLAGRLLPAAESCPTLRFVITMEPPKATAETSLSLLGWNDVLRQGKEAEKEGSVCAAQGTRGDTACLIYTSGTGGTPKGVMLSHGAILTNCRGAFELLSEIGLESDVFLSFLPLSHAYEHTAGLYFPISIGAEIYYAEGVETLAANLVEARPTLMTAVPRLYEVFHQRIMQAIERQGGTKEALFRKAVALGAKAYRTPDEMTWSERLINRLLDVLVRRKVKARFGGRLKALVSGGAPLNYEIGLFFTALGIRLLQGYGQTESAPVISCNRPSRNRIETVGPPYSGIEVKLAEDGEILVRGELVMQGYWRNEEATKEALKGGWLHTGDIGEIEPDGYLRITDRKKDIIINSGGDNISPQRIEGLLALEPEIAQAMAYGDKQPYLVALIVPDYERLRHEGDVAKKIEDAVARVNARLSQIEKVRRFALADEPFTIENELLTPTLKIRRHKIRARYGEKLNALYEGKR